MKFRLKDWALFLGFEGLFLLGLSIGIWGSKNFRPDSIAALVFFSASMISLLIGIAVWWAGSRLRGLEASDHISNPISLDDSFRAFLRFNQQPPLIKNEMFESRYLVLNAASHKIQLEKGVGCVVEHWSGPAIEVRGHRGYQRLAAREILRILSPKTMEIVLKPLNDEKLAEKDSESRLLIHFISAGSSVD